MPVEDVLFSETFACCKNDDCCCKHKVIHYASFQFIMKRRSKRKIIILGDYRIVNIALGSYFLKLKQYK